MCTVVAEPNMWVTSQTEKPIRTAHLAAMCMEGRWQRSCFDESLSGLV